MSDELICTNDDNVIQNAITIIKNTHDLRTLCKWHDEMNSWRYPSDLGFNESVKSLSRDNRTFLSDKYRAVNRILTLMIPPYYGVKYHLMVNMGHTEEYFEDYWENNMGFSLSRYVDKAKPSPS